MDHAEQTPRATLVAQSQSVEATTAAGFQPEPTQVLRPSSGESNGGNTGRDTQASSTRPLHPTSEGHAVQSHSHSQSPEDPYADFERAPPPPPRSRDAHVRLSSRRQTVTSGLPAPHRNASGIDWIVPVQEKARRTVGERLQPTIDNAVIERDKYARKALWTGYALNIAIGLQVFLGALTTGLAAALSSGRKAQVSTSILGGLSTLVASYMARARGSGEPELSITRVKDIEQFLRECRAFQLDHAHEYATPENHLGERLEHLRRRFEELLGNASGERKLSPVGITVTQTQTAPSNTAHIQSAV